MGVGCGLVLGRWRAGKGAAAALHLSRSAWTAEAEGIPGGAGRTSSDYLGAIAPRRSGSGKNDWTDGASPRSRRRPDERPRHCSRALRARRERVALAQGDLALVGGRGGTVAAVDAGLLTLLAGRGHGGTPSRAGTHLRVRCGRSATVALFRPLSRRMFRFHPFSPRRALELSPKVPLRPEPERHRRSPFAPRLRPGVWGTRCLRGVTAPAGGTPRARSAPGSRGRTRRRRSAGPSVHAR